MPNQPTILRVCEQCGAEFSVYPSRLKRPNAARFCSHHCRQIARTLPYLSDPWIERFWTHVEMTPFCWEWTGNLGSHGYGATSDHGTTILAHRAAWEIAYGPIPEGMWVLHACDNKVCVRPDHLFLGTHDDNMLDMHLKGRRGRTGTWKVTYLQAQEIRRRYAEGNILQRELAEEYGITQGAVSRILKGERQRHREPPY